MRRQLRVDRMHTEVQRPVETDRDCPLRVRKLRQRDIETCRADRLEIAPAAPTTGVAEQLRRGRGIDREDDVLRRDAGSLRVRRRRIGTKKLDGRVALLLLEPAELEAS